MRLMTQSQLSRDLRRAHVVSKQNHLDVRMQPRPASKRIPLNHAAVPRKRLPGCKYGKNPRNPPHETYFILDDDRFLVFAESAAQRVRNFSDRGIRFYRSQYGWQKIFFGRGSACQFRHRRFSLARVSPGA